MDCHKMQADFFRALAHPLRIRILYALSERKECVTDLTRYVHDTQPQVSRALGELKHAGLVSCEKTGTSICYKIKDKNALKILKISKEILKRENQSIMALLTPETRAK